MLAMAHNVQYIFRDSMYFVYFRCDFQVSCEGVLMSINLLLFDMYDILF